MRRRRASLLTTPWMHSLHHQHRFPPPLISWSWAGSSRPLTLPLMARARGQWLPPLVPMLARLLSLLAMSCAL
eukprot:12362198-Prorocentrum_lima.AAC.1